LEDQQFDELTKKLAGRVSRRTAVKAAVATAVGGVFALGKVAGAGAAFSQTCKCNGQPCFLDSQCCSGSCSGHLNGVKVCECLPGSTACQGAGAVTNCVPNCPAGQVLNAGTCTCGCPANTTTCVAGGVTHCLTCTGGAVPGPSCTGCVCPTGTTTCTNNGATTCLACAGGAVPNQTCSTCVPATGATCTVNTDCPSGQICSGGKCVANSPFCPVPGPTFNTCGTGCGPVGDCFCDTDTEGATHCYENFFCDAPLGAPCTSSSQCPSGSSCINASNGCGASYCVPECPCGSLTPGVSVKTNSTGGKTASGR
jgi:hypothetical protein